MSENKTLTNTLVGILIGISIGYMMNLGMSIPTGEYIAGVPELVEKVGSLRAAQMLLFYSGIIGASFGSMRFVWAREDWSLLKRTVIYFASNLAVMLLAAYQMCWVGRSPLSLVVFIGIFIAIFTIFWFINYAIEKKKIEKMNSALKNK